MLSYLGTFYPLWLCLLIHSRCSHGVTQDIKYDVLLQTTPLPENKDLFQNFEMVSKYGQRFTCQIPILKNENGSDSFPSLNNSYVHSLLAPLNRSQCLRFVKDWWTYELCYGKVLLQFHQEQNQRLSETVLGYFEYETDWNESVDFTNQSAKYHSQFYTNGSICDLTSNPRTSEVRYTCGSSTSFQIISVDETESCIYLFIVEAPTLCAHPAFVVKAPLKVEEILCGALIEDASQSSSNGVKTVISKKQYSSTSEDSSLSEMDSVRKDKRIYTLRRLHLNIRKRLQKQLARAAVLAARQFQTALSSADANQELTSSSPVYISFIWRVFIQSIVRAGGITPSNSFTNFVQSYEIRAIEDHLRYVLLSLMDKFEQLLGHTTLVFQIPSESLDYVCDLGEVLAEALESKVNETSGDTFPVVHKISQLQAALNSFEDLCSFLINPNVQQFPMDLSKFRKSQSHSKPLTIRHPPNAQCPAESELLRLLVVGFRHHLLRFRRLANSLREVEQMRATEAELETTFRGLLSRGKFNVLLVRGSVPSQKTKNVHDPLELTSSSESESETAPDDGSKPLNPVISLLKKVLRKVAPNNANDLEIYETHGLVDGYSAFYVMANEAKANEERRISEQEKAYRFVQKVRNET